MHVFSKFITVYANICQYFASCFEVLIVLVRVTLEIFLAFVVVRSLSDSTVTILTMKRQRISCARTDGAPTRSTRPVLRSSTNLTQIIKPSPAAWMSYKNLIKVVGVDCETGPSSWRKAIDHSAETVVFYQVDLRGTIPRMAKSVRISLEEGAGQSTQLRLVPSVFVGETLVSSSYVQTVIGRRFLADEDDLMKLLEHAGVLEYENVHELDEIRNEDSDEEGAENEPLPVLPEAKRTKTVLAVIPTAAARMASSKPRPPVTGTAHVPVSSQSGKIHAADSPAKQAASSIRVVSDGEQSSSMEPDCEISGLPTDDAIVRERGSTTADVETNDEQDETDEPVGLPEAPDEPETTNPEFPEDIPPFTNDEITALIDEVKVTPALWGRGKPSVARRQAAWTTVAGAVSRLTEPCQTEKTAEHCKRKWGSLMASFRRVWRTNKLATGWPWTEKLLFMVPSLEARKYGHGSARVPFTDGEGE